MKNQIARIEVFSKVYDARAAAMKNRLVKLGLADADLDLWICDIYTINKSFSSEELRKISSMLVNPATQNYVIARRNDEARYQTVLGEAIPPSTGLPRSPSVMSSGSNDLSVARNDSFNFSFAIEIGFLPGVTDNVAHTVREAVEDLLKTRFTDNEGVYSSQLFFIKGKVAQKTMKALAETLYNPLIQQIHIKDFENFKKGGGMDFVVPHVRITETPKVTEVNLNVSDEELEKIGRYGIANPDGSRRGPLALDLKYMKAIQAYFKKLRRPPNDIEIESLAQTWSEHCKHTIFANPIDELEDGLFKTYIKGATKEIRKKRGKKDFCVSVFTDNSGAILFDDEYLVTHKVETHNSPSALDPYGGAITGIVGVNRDTIGFGMGAKPVANFYGFCLANPQADMPLYKDKNKLMKMLSSSQIMEGVIAGVNSGGNQSGIPTPQGFVYFDECFRGKPLVFVGTVGLIPRKIKRKPSHIKKAQPGDYVVMAGGRVGKDGIHGATFSSEALGSTSPATAVQLGDPITQKKLSDAIVKEARDGLLYNSITDNGAGGLSCSVAEMAKESGGCVVDLDKVPLKYPHLEPWEIWISESQERMTLAVPKKTWEKFSDLMKRRGVEATIIGEFTDSGKCVIKLKGKIIMDLDLEFLHEGLPKRKMVTKKPEIRISKSETNSNDQNKNEKNVLNFENSNFDITAGAGLQPDPKHSEASYKLASALNSSFQEPTNYGKTLLQMLSRLNIASYEFISTQYDHIVQANAVLGPLQGRGRVNGDASVIRPVLSSQKGVVMSQALYPSYSELDPYKMAGASIDTAIRNAVAVGANPDYLSLLDNFCWCSPDNPERLWQLKQAAKACFDFAVAYGTPFISGKDSMFNDFNGFDKDGNSVKISILPTLLISSFGVIDDITKVASLDAKMAGDPVYILGETFDEMGGSEYLALINEQDKKLYTSQQVPTISSQKNKKLYQAFYQGIQKNLIASSISLKQGGLGVALVKKAIGGMLGITIDLKQICTNVNRDDIALYSESQGRILVTIAAENKTAFEKIFEENSFALVGKVTKEPHIIIKGLQGHKIINLELDEAVKTYRETFKDY